MLLKAPCDRGAFNTLFFEFVKWRVEELDVDCEIICFKKEILVWKMISYKKNYQQMFPIKGLVLISNPTLWIFPLEKDFHQDSKNIDGW